MYRTTLNRRDKGGAIAAVVGIHAGLLFALLHLSGRIDLADPQSTLRVLDLRDIPPPLPEPPPPPPPEQQQAAKPKEKEGGSAPNLKSEATPVVAPKPIVEAQRPNPIAVTETPREGAAPTQGASTIAGPGTGTGGSGTGTGTGNGSGSGGGGDGGVAEPPQLATPVLRGRDFARSMLDQWPRGAPVFLRLRVSPRGTVSECNVLRGTGNPDIDGAMCNIAYERLRFRPALNRSGQAVAGWFGYAQRPPR
jgi:protein TonB